MYNTNTIPKNPTNKNHLESGIMVSKKYIALPNKEKTKLAMAILSSFIR